jgi:hypothetical protein
VPAEDGKMPADLKPQVRDGVTVDYLADGPDLLAEAGRIILRTGQPVVAEGPSLRPQGPRHLLINRCPVRAASFVVVVETNHHHPASLSHVRLRLSCRS